MCWWEDGVLGCEGTDRAGDVVLSRPRGYSAITQEPRRHSRCDPSQRISPIDNGVSLLRVQSCIWKKCRARVTIQIL